MNNIHSKRVLVVGAGVAGLVTATVLRREGWAVDLVESSDALRAVGYKVDIRGSAVEVLRRLGLEEGARRRHCRVRAGSIVTSDGAVVAAMGGDTFGGRVGDDIELERGDLIGLLADAAGRVRHGVSPTTVDAQSAGVLVGFDDGRQETYDVVVGADGVHSTVRRLAGIGDDQVERQMGYAIAVTELPAAGLDREEVTYVRPHATALAYATATSDAARAMVLFAHRGRLPREHRERMVLLRHAFPDTAWRLPELLAAFEASPGFYLDTMSQVTLPSWHRGRVVLVGDAAWCASPASGQGTTLAILGGYVTARLLNDLADDPAAAFAEAHRRLAPLVDRNQALGRSNIKRMVLSSGREVTLTLWSLRLLRLLRLEDRVLGTVSRQLARASRVDLP